MLVKLDDLSVAFNGGGDARSEELPLPDRVPGEDGSLPLVHRAYVSLGKLRVDAWLVLSLPKEPGPITGHGTYRLGTVAVAGERTKDGVTMRVTLTPRDLESKTDDEPTLPGGVRLVPPLELRGTVDRDTGDVTGTCSATDGDSDGRFCIWEPSTMPQPLVYRPWFVVVCDTLATLCGR